MSAASLPQRYIGVMEETRAPGVPRALSPECGYARALEDLIEPYLGRYDAAQVEQLRRTGAILETRV